MKLDNDSKKISRIIKKTGLSVNKKTIYMEELFEDIREAYNFVNITNLHINKFVTKIQNVVEAEQIMNKSDMTSSYVDNHVHDSISSSLIYSIKYSFRMFNRSYTIEFNICEILDVENVDNMFDRVIMWLYVVNLYSPPKCSKKIDIHFFLCDAKKLLPSNSIDIIGKSHVNSGYTYCCPIENQIVIYRKEEWFKVFIHETMHSFGLDFCNNSTNKTIKSYMNSVFTVKSNMNIYESYSETWAVIINNAFGAFLTEPIDKYRKFSSRFRNLMSDEVSFSLIQMNKILTHMGLEYKDLSSKTSSSSIKRLLYKEESEVFSYYIIKTILLYHYNLFIKWCDENNHSLIKFNTRDSNIQNFCSFIISIHNKTGFIESVRKAKKIVDVLNKKNTFISNTARMSAHSFMF